MTPATRRILWEVCPLSRADLDRLAGLGVTDPGKWKATRNGEIVVRASRKVDAVEFAVTTARSAWRAIGQTATLKIKGRDGRIQSERTYGHDPETTKG